MADFDGVKTKWLNDFLEKNIPLVAHLTPDTPNWQDKAFEFANKLEETLCDRQLTEPYQQKNARSQVVHVLRQYHPQHPAIPHPYVLLSSETYTQLNIEQLQKTDQRQTKFFSGADAIALVDKAASLLDSDNPNDIAAALAVLIGRRISEILISQFDPCSPYSIWFSEPVKKSSFMPPLEIPTLIEADKVLSGIAHLRDVWNIEDLKNQADSERQLKQAINKRYEDVPKAVRRHYKDLIPGREADNDSGEKLYTHVFRSVYAEIATYFYKPSTVPDHRFKAEIQGHFSITAHGQVRSYTSRPHYDDYKISDRSPSQDGIKLSLPDVSLLSVFVDENADKDARDHQKASLADSSTEPIIIASPEEPTIIPSSSPQTPSSSPSYPQDLILVLQKQYDLAINSNQQKYQAIIQGKEDVIAQKDALIEDKSQHIAFLSQQLKLANERSIVPSYPDLSSENEQLKATMENLKQKLSDLETQRDNALSKLAELEAVISQFKTLLHPNSQSTNTAAHQTPENPHLDKEPSPHPQNNSLTTENDYHHLKTKLVTVNDPRTAIVDRALNAIKNYNNDPTRTYQEKWYISNPILADLIRSSGFKVAGKFLQDYLRHRSVDLEQHHSYHQLSCRHNVKHDLPISDFISIT